MPAARGKTCQVDLRHFRFSQFSNIFLVIDQARSGVSDGTERSAAMCDFAEQAFIALAHKGFSCPAILVGVETGAFISMPSKSAINAAFQCGTKKLLTAGHIIE
jgi:hypothetical protein